MSMTSDTGMTIHRGAAALIAIGLTAAGAGATYLLTRRDSEGERLGLRPAASTASANATSASSTAGRSGESVQTAKIVVSEHGYEPATITLRAGTPARITFLRTTDKTCAAEVVFPSLNIKRALPVNEPVRIEFTPAKSGDIAFACGMNMLEGVIVVR
jgi:plastocyanin